MNAPSTACPRCGTASTGKFCGNCGAPLAAATCPSCRAPLTPGARFCHVCGTPLGAHRKHALGVPWLVGVAAAVILVAVAAFAVGRSSPGSGGPAAAPRGAGGPMGGPPPASDISNMSPREAATRLFDRVMGLAERGVTDSVTFFAPMAIQTYGLLDSLDNDARYDVGMIYAVTGNHDSALAMADALEAAVPGHLLATVLRHEVGETRGDDAAIEGAYRSFLESYPTESGVDRQEYTLHRRTIDAFLARARQAVGTTPDG